MRPLSSVRPTASSSRRKGKPHRLPKAAVVLESSSQSPERSAAAAAAAAGAVSKQQQQQNMQQHTTPMLSPPAGGAGAALGAAADAGDSYMPARVLQVQQQQQQQQRQLQVSHNAPQSSMTVESLLLLLDADSSLKEYQVIAFQRMLKQLCSLTDQSAATADAAALLSAAPELLLPHLLQAVDDNRLQYKTVYNTLSYVQHLLQVQAVRELFSAAALEEVQEQMAEARQDVLAREKPARARQLAEAATNCSMHRIAAAEAQGTRRKGRNEQQQKQHQEEEEEEELAFPVALTTAELRSLLARHFHDAPSFMTVFNVWQQLCGTDDVASLLGRFEELQQPLSSSGLTAKTLTWNYYRKLQLVLEVPQVQQLLEPQQLRALVARVNEAVEAPTAAAAEGAAARTAPSSLAAAATQQVQIAAPAMSLEQLKRLLTEAFDSTSVADKAMSAFTVWSKACGSDDMAVILRNFQPLQQRLNGTDAAGNAAYSTATAQQYLRYICRALELLPELQELAGGQQQTQQLLGQVNAAIIKVKVGCSAVTALQPCSVCWPVLPVSCKQFSC
jgi:hypothetical protein